MERIAILTAFREFIPGYSLTGIVQDQAQLLARQGHDVDIWVCEDYIPTGGQEQPWWGSGQVRPLVPHAQLKDYNSREQIGSEHQEVAQRFANVCRERLKDYQVVFTHDLAFTGWNVPYALGIQQAAPDLPEQRWLHWIHSIPTRTKDWWRLRDYGPKHKIVYPNKTDAPLVAEQYQTDLDGIRVIPHPKDLRSWFEFDPLTWGFIDEYPGVMQADVVQIYPASTDRLQAKRVRELIRLFSEIKNLGFSVCLVLANQHATDRQRKEDITQYQKLAKRYGLTGDEVIFTSIWREGEFEKGLPRRVVRELMQCANLFVFPTREETFGLVMPEAVLSGGVLPVLNKSLPMMMEVSGMFADYVDFGSYCQIQTQPNEGEWLKEMAKTILGRMRANESVLTKTFVRQTYNFENLYKVWYGPILGESKLW